MKGFSIKQKLAIKQLEAAFKACANAELEFCGVDDNLYVVTGDAIRANPQKFVGDYCNIIKAAQSCGPGTATVKTHGAYIDSGGF